MKETILNALKSQCGLNEKRALHEYENIHKYQDIEKEFMQTLEYGFKKEDMIRVEGYTAKKLYDLYDLSILGSYNYLVSLRDQPELALTFLQKGLPRK